MPTFNRQKLWGYLQVKKRRLKDKLHGRQMVHFLHIGKTGGTAVSHALRPHMHGDRIALYIHAHKVTLRDVPRGEAVFFFVRDPIKRFVSGFYGRQRQDQPRYFSPWSAAEARAFSRFDTPNALATALSSPDAPRKQAAEDAMHSIQHVRDSYWYWFDNAAYFRARAADVLFIGHQNTLTADFERLKVLLHLPPDVTLPRDDIHAHRNPGSLDKRLDETAVRNLRAWYQADYDFLALCAEIDPAH